jgi:hypothetical protein
MQKYMQKCAKIFFKLNILAQILAQMCLICAIDLFIYQLSAPELRPKLSRLSEIPSSLRLELHRAKFIYSPYLFLTKNSPKNILVLNYF